MSSATTRGSAFRQSILLTAAGICFAVVALLTGAGKVWGQGGVTFGIRPAAESAGAYFAYTLEPGAKKTDSALVTNSGGAALTLQVYSADAITASGGGTAFGAFGERRTGVGAWVSTPQAQLNLAAGATVAVPVTIAVPLGMAPGEYVAGIVVEAPPRAGAAGGTVNTIVTERAGVAIVVRVPGTAVEKLAVGSFCFNQETGSRYFEIPVRNVGAVVSTANGTFRLETEKGVHVFERVVELGSVIPTLDTVVRVHSPQDPPPGKYVARLSLRQKDGQEVQRDSSITVPEKRANGCDREAAPNGQQSDQGKGDNFEVHATREAAVQVKDEAGSWLTLVLLAALGATTGALVFVLLRHRRQRRQGGPGLSA